MYVYCAVIMTQVIARVHPVDLTNVDQRQAAVDPQTKPTDLGCELLCRLLLIVCIHHSIYYYSARKLILSLQAHSGKRLSQRVNLGTEGERNLPKVFTHSDQVRSRTRVPSIRNVYHHTTKSRCVFKLF